jgi:hypothetical protein
MRWRKAPNERARHGACFEFLHGQRVLVTVAEGAHGFYWYGLGQNTAYRPLDSGDQAKREAERHAREVMAAADRAEQRGSA